MPRYAAIFSLDGVAFALVVICCVTSVRLASGQEAPVLPPEGTIPQPSQGVLSQPSQYYEQLSAFPGSVAPIAAPVQLGPVDFHPHLLYMFTYGNGILAAPGLSAKSVVQTVSPGLLLNIGTHWTLDYTPTLTYYSSPLFRNSLGELVNLNWFTVYQDWSFQLSQGYSDSTAPLVETGAQTEQIVYSTLLSAAYQMSEQLSLSLSAAQSLNTTPGYISYDSWSGTAGLNDQISRQFTAGFSVSGGYQSVSEGSDSVFENLQAQLHWRPGQKLDLQLSGGIEDSEYLGLQSQSVLTPIYSANLHYQVTQTTSFGLTGARTVTPSPFQDQLIEATSVTASIRQRLFKVLNLDLTGGYSSTPYQGVQFAINPYVPVIHPIGTPITTSILTTRQDTTSFFRAALSFPFIQRGLASIFYSINDNTSNVAGFSYSSTQLGFDLSYRF